MKYRPLIRYYGGKSRISGWVISHFPKHRVYTEAYGGAASCLLRKERAYAEIYNDLNGELVNLFRVVRDQGPELLRRISLTPFSRQEMLEAYDHGVDAVEQARRTIVKAQMGFGSDSFKRINGFRGCINRKGSTPSHDWASYPPVLARIIERFQGVVIESIADGALLAKAGLKKGDVIRSMNKKSVANVSDLANIYQEINWTGHGEVEFIRNQQGGKVTVSFK